MRRRAHLEPVKQVGSRLRHSVNSGLERLSVVRRRRAETTDLSYVLQRGSLHVLGRDVLGEGLAQGLDASAHGPNLTGHRDS